MASDASQPTKPVIAVWLFAAAVVVLLPSRAMAVERNPRELCHEAAGDAEKAREHITQAAGPYRMDHSMGQVAVMHAKLRGWEQAAVEASAQ